MDNTIKELYGSYEIPEEVTRLYELERELNEIDLSLSMIGFEPCHYDFWYPISPPDFIPLAHTGGDGIHFGFLTEFGQAPSLIEAPIVCVTPTNDPPLRYIAANIKEFLDLVFSVPYAEMLEGFWANPDETHIQQVIKEFEEDTPSDWFEKRRKIAERFQDKLETHHVQIGSYLQQVQEKRAKSISITTLDGLGIAGSDEQNIPYKQYPFDLMKDQNRYLDDDELMRIRDYLKERNRIEKLAFIRDIIFVVELEENSYNLVIDLLESLNLQDEIHRFTR